MLLSALIDKKSASIGWAETHFVFGEGYSCLSFFSGKYSHLLIFAPTLSRADDKNPDLVIIVVDQTSGRSGGEN